jgi:hypothetical protein
MITLPTGETILTSVTGAFRQKWGTLPQDEFLYRYLLAYTALKPYYDGLPDEEQKVLKHYGIKYWEPGMEEVQFEGRTYKVIMNDER